MTYELNDIRPCEHCISVHMGGSGFRQGSPEDESEQYVTAADVERLVDENRRLQTANDDLVTEWRKTSGELEASRTAVAAKLRRARLVLEEQAKATSNGRQLFKKALEALG